MTTPGPGEDLPQGGSTPITRLELAQQLAAAGKSQEEILETLVMTEPSARPMAPFRGEDRGDSGSGGSAETGWDRGGAKTTGSPRGPSQATRLVELGFDADLFHSPDGQTYAAVPMGLHRETWALKSNGSKVAFEALLSNGREGPEWPSPPGCSRCAHWKGSVRRAGGCRTYTDCHGR